MSVGARLQVALRPATADEAGALSGLALEAKALWGYSRAQLDLWKSDLTLTPGSIAQRPTFVAVADAAITGFYQLVLEPKRADLEHFWVRPQFARRGIGRALLEHAVRLAASTGHEELEIDADPNAEPFYLARGAIRVGVVDAPTRADPGRVRPQLRIALKQLEGQRV